MSKIEISSKERETMLISAELLRTAWRANIITDGLALELMLLSARMIASAKTPASYDWQDYANQVFSEACYDLQQTKCADDFLNMISSFGKGKK